MSGSNYTTQNLQEPLDLIKFSLNENIFIKCRHQRDLKGRLQAYDQHLNMVLSDVEESSIEEEIDNVSNKIINKQKVKKMPMIFIRGDTIILISTNLKSRANQ